MDKHNAEKKLSIIILNYKTRALLRQLLHALTLYKPQLDHEIIVVDNNSCDGTVDMMRREFPNISFTALNYNSGYPKGSNVGIKQARGEFLLFMNTDIVVEAGAIEVLCDYLTQHDRVGAVGPLLLNPDGSLQHSAFRFHRFFTPIIHRTILGNTHSGKKEINRFLMQDWCHDSERPIDWLMSSCLLVRRKAMENVGVFDERLFLYFADTDLCRRLWEAGWEVWFTPKARFVHYYRRQSADDWRVALLHIKDWLRYFYYWRGRKVPQASEQIAIGKKVR